MGLDLEVIGHCGTISSDQRIAIINRFGNLNPVTSYRSAKAVYFIYFYTRHKMSDFQASILIVDDQKIDGQFHQRLLKRCYNGFTVEVCYSGFAALAELRKTTFDLIFMDLHMPLMGGIEATLEIRRHEITTPIVGLTGDEVTPELIEQCKKAGMLDIVQKPLFLNEELFPQLAAWMGVRQPPFTPQLPNNKWRPKQDGVAELPPEERFLEDIRRQVMETMQQCPHRILQELILNWRFSKMELAKFIKGHTSKITAAMQDKPEKIYDYLYHNQVEKMIRVYQHMQKYETMLRNFLNNEGQHDF